MTYKDIVDLYIKGKITISETRRLLNKLLGSQLVKRYEKNIHWCRNCNQAGVPNTGCINENIPRVSFDYSDSDSNKIYILKEHLNGIINTVSEMRYGSADKKQFNATLEYNLNNALERQKQQICQTIRECGHQQEDDTVWCEMDELLSKIKYY